MARPIAPTDHRVGFGFRRLSIIDLRPAAQPADRQRRRLDPARVQRRDLQLPRAAAVARGAGHRLPLQQRFGSDRAPLRRAGRTRVRGARRHVRAGDLGQPLRAADAGARPRRQEAVVCLARRDPGRVCVGDEGVCGAAGSRARDRRDRHSVLLPVRLRAASADVLSRRAAGRAGYVRHVRPQRAGARRTVLAADVPGRAPPAAAAAVCRGRHARPRARDRGGRAPVDQRRAARRVPQRRHRLDDRRRADAAPARRAGAHLHDRIRGRRLLRRNGRRGRNRARVGRRRTPSSG